MDTIKGRVIDSRTAEALSGVKVTLGSARSTTDGQGNFVIEFDGDNPPSSLRSIKGGYAPQTTPALTQQGNLKQKVNVIALKPLTPDFGIELPSIIVFGRSQLNSLKGRFGFSPEAKFIELLMRETSKIYQRLIPFALKQLANFGIEDPADLDVKSCPPITTINSTITEKNKTTRQLNNSFKSITSAKNQGNILKRLLQAFSIIRKLLGTNPTPTAAGVPPSPAGGVFPPPLTKTMGQVTSYDSKREKIDKIIERIKGVAEVIPDGTIPLSIALSEAIDILNATDQAVGECLNDVRQQVLNELSGSGATGAVSGSDVGIGVGSNGEYIAGGGVDASDASAAGVTTIDNFDFSTVSEAQLRDIVGLPSDSDVSVQDLLAGNYLQEQLDSELLALTEDAANDGQPSVTIYNGFYISVETETEEEAKGLSIKRRFAVGKNADGVTLVKGEKSYSSNDQILIDELIFTIDSNDLTVN